MRNWSILDRRSNIECHFQKHVSYYNRAEDNDVYNFHSDIIHPKSKRFSGWHSNAFGDAAPDQHIYRIVFKRISFDDDVVYLGVMCGDNGIIQMPMPDADTIITCRTKIKNRPLRTLFRIDSIWNEYKHCALHIWIWFIETCITLQPSQSALLLFFRCSTAYQLFSYNIIRAHALVSCN